MKKKELGQCCLVPSFVFNVSYHVKVTEIKFIFSFSNIKIFPSLNSTNLVEI